MISKNQAKFIKSLQLKKYRKQAQCFVVDGEKGVKEAILSDFELVQVVCTESFEESNQSLFPKGVEVIIANEKQLSQISSFQTNENALAVLRQKPNQIPEIGAGEFVLVLDDIRDPGNLGSIIRSADWFGVRKIIASPETADFYNPKVINATMGSFARVSFGYSDLVDLFSNTNANVYGTFMKGNDVHSFSFTAPAFIVIGNEGQGISHQVERFVTDRISIPGVKGAESLNAAVATGIVLDNLSRLKK
ncbi:MAG: TrmH family RNA methyltransferase [Cyclobacteriaceae bacterium]